MQTHMPTQNLSLFSLSVRYFVTRSHYVPLAVLEFLMQRRPALNPRDLPTSAGCGTGHQEDLLKRQMWENQKFEDSLSSTLRTGQMARWVKALATNLIPGATERR